MFDEDNREKSLFYRPKATIHVSGPDGETLPPIVVDESLIDLAPATLVRDSAAVSESARQIANFESAIAEQCASRLEASDPVLSAAIRRELARQTTKHR